MKKSLLIFMAVMFVLMAIPAFAAADISDIVFDEESVTPALTVSGYPRFETLDDGTLLIFNAGVVRKSTDDGETWTRIAITQNSATEYTSSSGITHALSRENWQGFVMDDGTVMVAYRARTKDYTSGEFYTSIRFMTSTDDAATFDNEVVVAEAVTDSFNGYWEPFIIQPDENTVLIYYSDDLNVTTPNNQQNIVYHEYNLTTKTVGDAVVAINGEDRNSRDGMPVITKLRYGGYAMVIETHDYFGRIYMPTLTYGNSVFVVGLSLSEDGKTWSKPVPVVAPADITGGGRCAAPYITTLPDGRVLISYMTTDGYTGAETTDAPHKNCVYGAVISDDVLTADTTITATKGGVATGFTALHDLFEEPETGYMIWNTVYSNDEYAYFAGSAGTNDASVSSSIRIRRADVSATVVSSDMDKDGNVTLKDALRIFKGVLDTKVYKYDINNDGEVTLEDALIVLKETLN